MNKKLKVLHDSVLIRPEDDSTGNGGNGGIMLPDSAKQKPTEGKVLEVGEGSRDGDGKIIPSSLKKGDRVMYRKWAGTEIKFNGEDLVVMKESDIIGIIE